MCCRMFSNIPDLYPLEASRNKNVCRYHQIFSEGQGQKPLTSLLDQEIDCFQSPNSVRCHLAFSQSVLSQVTTFIAPLPVFHWCVCLNFIWNRILCKVHSLHLPQSSTSYFVHCFAQIISFQWHAMLIPVNTPQFTRSATEGHQRCL